MLNNSTRVVIGRSLGWRVATMAVAVVVACGTGIGNPGGFRSPLEDESYAPIGADLIPSCGYFNQLNTDVDVEVGRTCLRQAFAQCEAASLYVSDVTGPSSYYQSFIEVLPASPCQLRVHLSSNDPSVFVGNEIRLCTHLASDERPEFACGFGQGP